MFAGLRQQIIRVEGFCRVLTGRDLTVINGSEFSLSANHVKRATQRSGGITPSLVIRLHVVISERLLDLDQELEVVVVDPCYRLVGDFSNSFRLSTEK